jgi:transposase InsO family protein
VPREILYDNAKTIVLERDAYGKGEHRWHPGMLDLAKRYGFIPRLCQPYRARTKGKVERFHRYLRGNFYVPLSSWLKQSGMVLDVDTANAELGKWLRDVANQRVHPVTGAAPIALFEQRERALLRELPMFATPLSAPKSASRPSAGLTMPLQHPLSVYQQLLTEVRA